MDTAQLPDLSQVELPQDRALRLGAERLQAAVATPPQRYAPFFARLADLWQIPAEAVVAQLARAAEPRHWRKTLLSGLERFDIELSRPPSRPLSRPLSRPPSRPPGGQHAHLLRFAPGAVFPLHRHRGNERVLVLEGSYADDTGRQVRAGDTQTMPPGSEHRLRILGDVPCVAAVSEHGVSFVTPWLRRLLQSLTRLKK